MNFYSKLTPIYEDYLLRLIFGSTVETDPLSVCVNTAYLDFNRTLRGISKVQTGAKLHTDAVGLLITSVEELKTALGTTTTQASFDDWHRDTCMKLISIYEGSFTVFGGQAQKWVNMTLKYVYTLGAKRISGFEAAYPLCHAPLDNIVLEGLAKVGLPKLSCAWSQLDYDEYFNRQEWIRETFMLPPLDMEFLLWLGRPLEPEHLRKAAL
jgi:hypothetical protein